MTAKTKLATVLVVAVGVIAIPLVVKSRSRATVTADATSPCDSAQPAGSAGRCVPAASAPIAAPRPRFVDLGTTTCAPCRVMLGVMGKLEQQYPDALVVQFINVQKNRDSVRQYHISIIPTQIFYSPEGRELFRHTGVMRVGDVVAKWRQLGYDLGTPSTDG